MYYTKEMLEIMGAFEQGQPIQARYKLLDEQPWRDVTNPYWIWNLFEYRIKPDTKPMKKEMVKGSSTKSIKDMVAVMLAYDAGVPIEVRTRDKFSTWSDVLVDPLWDWRNHDYRIKLIPEE